jgi:hypothetical protein
MPALKNDGLDFLRQLSFAMQSNPVKPQDKGLFGQFSRMGLTDKEFDERNISPARSGRCETWTSGCTNVAVSTLVSTSQVRDGWSYVRG